MSRLHHDFAILAHSHREHREAVALYRRLNANSLVAEVNMGGEMVRSVLRQVDASVP